MHYFNSLLPQLIIPHLFILRFILFSVQQLSLRYNQITDTGAALLGTALGSTTYQNSTLLSLNLTGNQLTDTGAECIAKVYMIVFVIIFRYPLDLLLQI